MKNLILTAAALLGLAAGTLAQSLPNYVPADGLVGWWPFNGNANDESGNGNNGTVNGATLTTDRLGNADKAYIFDGIDDFISTQYLGISGSFARSFNGWFKTVFNSSSNDQPGKTILIYGSGTGSVVGDRFEIELGHSCNGLGLDISGFYYVKSNSDINYSDNNWHMFTVVMNPNSQLSNIDFFLDGVLLNSYSCGTSVQLNTSIQTGLNIGRNYLSNGGRYFPGSIDDIAIYNRALTQEEITALYTGEPINPPTACNPLPTNLQNGLVGYWPFCGNANDESGNGNDGTVIGATLTEDRFGVANSAYDFNRDVVNEINVNSSALMDSIRNITISLWVNLNSFGINGEAGYNHFINKSDQSNNHHFIFANNFEQLYFYYGGGSNFFFTNNLPPLGQWSNIVVSYAYDGILGNSFCKFYIDGQLVDSMPTTQNLNLTDNDIKIGTFSNENYNRVDGSLDDIGIWNRALSADEVQQLYTLNACTFTVYDTLTVENVVNVFDTTTVTETLYDTVTVIETLYETVYDTVTTFTSVTDTLIINTLITGINPPNNSNTIKVFPNPAGSFITIDYGNFALMSGYQLRIENSLGQQVFQTNITQQTDSLSLSSWGGNGLYFVHIVDPQGNTIDIRKIVLQ